MGEDDSEPTAGQEPWVLPAARQGGLPRGQEGQRPTRAQGVHDQFCMQDVCLFMLLHDARC